MSSETYDVVVVGAGLMGSSAAYYAAREGRRVALLEQFTLLHSQGSSHGTSRIFRIAYPDAVYSKMCLQSLHMWQDIEKASGVCLLEMTGELDFADTRSKELETVCAVLEELGQPFDRLTAAQVGARFPSFSLPTSAQAVYNPTAAVLNPTLAMQTLQDMSKAMGADVFENTRVKSISQDEGAPGIKISLEGGKILCARTCIVTAGAWTRTLLADYNIPIRPIATFGTYWKIDPTFENEHRAPAFPVFIKYDEPSIYGLPLKELNEGVKVCLHSGPEVDPDQRQQVRQLPDPHLAMLKGCIQKYLPHVDASRVVKQDLCMYSMTTDHDFIIDRIPLGAGSTNYKELVVGAGFSGHGAKMTPVIGKMLVDMAFGREDPTALEKFRLARFLD